MVEQYLKLKPYIDIVAMDCEAVKTVAEEFTPTHIALCRRFAELLKPFRDATNYVNFCLYAHENLA
jgi:hypothetical protein